MADVTNEFLKTQLRQLRLRGTPPQPIKPSPSSCSV